MRGDVRGVGASVITYLDWDTGEPGSAGDCVLGTPNNAGIGNWITRDCTELHLFVCAKG